MAEFFRLALLTGLCEPAVVAHWAESIVIAEPVPHIAFIELCIAGSQPAIAVAALLVEVPGQASPKLPARMLLGYASRLLSDRILGPSKSFLASSAIAQLCRIEWNPNL